MTRSPARASAGPGRILGLILAAAALGACGDSRPIRERAAAPAAGPAGPTADTLARGCDWILVFDPDQPGLGNTAFPDTGVRYWTAVVSADVPAGSRLRMEGQYPNARYSSLAVQDGTLQTLDILADYELAPDPGNRNPFLDQTRQESSDFGGRYTAFVRIGSDATAQRERNTLYRAPPGALDSTQKRRTAITYRSYLPVGGNHGGVALPALTLETPSGDVPLANPADAQACAPIATALRQDGATIPGSANLFDPVPAQPQPAFKRYNPSIGAVSFNQHNGFLFTKNDGLVYPPIMLVRGRPPSYTTQDGAGNPPQVRYWSMCVAGFSSQRVYACFADRDVPLDDAGYYTFAITPDATQPAAMSAARGYAWLNRGPEQVAAITHRELLAHPSFAEATVNIGALQMPAAVKGEYLPLATYCTQAVFDGAAALGPAQAFAACVESRRLVSQVPSP
jgi:hypothetical protein